MRVITDEPMSLAAGESALDALTIPRRDLGESRLSFAQERLWLVDQVTGPTSVYNLPVALRLRGPLDAKALTRALDAIVARHAALRVVIDTRGGEPVQRVRPPFSLGLTEDDIRALPEREREAEALRLAYASARRPFDLARGPLARARLVRVEDDDHLLVLTFHHIVFDGWSVGLLYREIERLYAGAVSAAGARLDPLPIEFPDYAEWQRERDEAPTAAYWRRVFADATPPAGLVEPVPRAATEVPPAGVCDRGFAPAVAEAVARFCRAREVTSFLVHFASYVAWVSKRIAGDDIVVSVPVAGRSQADTHPLIGFFVNSLPIRVRVDRRASFAALLGAVRDVMIEAYGHQDLSSRVLLDVVPRRRDATHGSLIPLAFALDIPPDPPRLPRIVATPVDLADEKAKDDFGITVLERPAGVTLRATYAADLFEPPQVDGMLAELARLTHAAIAHPDATLDSLCSLARVRSGGPEVPRTIGPVESAISPADRQLVIDAWNRTDVPGTTDRTVVDLFEARAALDPDAVAIEDDGEQVRYGELRARATRIASALREAGAERDALVALCVPRSAAQIAAVLGILRAGAAYLPLDAALPDERIRSVLGAAGARLVVTTRSLRDRIGSGVATTLIVEELLETPRSCFDRLSTNGARAGAGGAQPESDVQPVRGALESAEAAVDPVRGALEPGEAATVDPVRAEPVEARTAAGGRPSDLAYVIYTSGSTGTPKGVEIEHASLANFVRFVMSYLGITSADRVLQFASLGFDTAAEEIFPALAAGATLVLRTDAMLESVDAFLDRSEALRLSVLDLPTAYWHTLVDLAAGRRPFPPCIRAVTVGGEAVRPDVLAKWHAWVGSRVRLFNGYGPTETTVCATYGELTEPDVRDTGGAGPVSIGTPLWNTRVYVLDAAGQPVAPETVGELYVGGAGVARGYRDAPMLTAERFVADPFRPGQRMYRTGDRARWRRTGHLEYAGRVDRQVKIRGHRVEPDEVEAHLRAHPAVREASVVVDATGGAPRLIAYVECGDAAPDASHLRQFLAGRLPAAMVPSLVVCLATLPRNLNGKVDRDALPAPPNDAAAPAAGGPLSSTAAIVAAVWREVLELPQIGAHDNFFDLGGHSLLGTRVVARLADQLKTRVPLSLLFEHPTVAGVADALDRLRDGGQAPRRPITRRVPAVRVLVEAEGNDVTRS